MVAAAIVTAIQAAGITGVTARAVYGSNWVLEATGGMDLNLAIRTSGTNSNASLLLGNIGLAASMQTMWGSGAASVAVGNYNGQSSAIAKAVAINAVQTTSEVQATAQSNMATGSAAVAAGTINSGDVSSTVTT